MEKINMFILCYLNCIHKHNTVLFCCTNVTIWHILRNSKYFFYYSNTHTSAKVIVTEKYVTAIPKK